MSQQPHRGEVAQVSPCAERANVLGAVGQISCKNALNDDVANVELVPFVEVGDEVEPG